MSPEYRNAPAMRIDTGGEETDVVWLDLAPGECHMRVAVIPSPGRLRNRL